MVTEDHREILQKILELADTACQVDLELMEQFAAGNEKAVAGLLADLHTAVRVIAAAQEPLLPVLEHAYTREMLENIEDALDEIERAIRQNQPEQAVIGMEFHLLPLLRQLKEAFYYWGMIYPDRMAMHHYYQEEFAAHYRNFYLDGENPPQYRASVVVVAYNHLDMTKQCVESILKYTNFEKLNAQLILVDHGSTDGVLEYFQGLGIGIVIHYKVNMRGTMFCVLPQICNSEYYVHVANDTVVTKDWLEILLCCADSDTKIASVAPATCNLSNLQSVNVPTSDCGTLLEWAEVNNRSDPHLWNDRARVLPAIGLFRVSALNEVGFWDPMFYTFDFMDDDFSLNARRYGYRQILCEDVVCYHRGSATVKDNQIKEDTLGEGRRLFQEKHGVDAWGTGFCYDPYGISLAQFASGSEAANILGIDCGFGDTILQMRNQYRRVERESKIYHVTSEVCYLPDLKPQSDGTVYVSPGELLARLPSCFSELQFDMLFLGQSLEYYTEPYRLLEVLSQRMAPGGQLVLFFQNPYFALRLHQMLQFSIPDSPLCLLHPEHVKAEAERSFSSVTLCSVKQPVSGLDDFVVRHYGRDFLRSTQKSRLEISQYYMYCVK